MKHVKGPIRRPVFIAGAVTVNKGNHYVSEIRKLMIQKLFIDAIVKPNVFSGPTKSLSRFSDRQGKNSEKQFYYFLLIFQEDTYDARRKCRSIMLGFSFSSVYSELLIQRLAKIRALTKNIEYVVRVPFRTNYKLRFF